MPSSFNKKAKTINVNLTQDEYNKIQKLAEIRHLNPTSYTKQVALGNRIKPTVIEYPQEQTTIEDDESTNNLHEVNEQLKKDNEALKSDVVAFRVKANLLDELLTHLNENAYIDFNGFRDDEELRYKLKTIKQNEGGVTFE
ncbi:plasmid mobilization protein [Staphylococcus haemolyticus]|uniref:plasmid mobilization protein n=1 Tax=Staphylococcus haemolyticus TaxID=1283 RepID=UPI0039815E26